MIDSLPEKAATSMNPNHTSVAVVFEGANVKDRPFVEVLQARVVEESLVEQNERPDAQKLERQVDTGIMLMPRHDPSGQWSEPPKGNSHQHFERCRAPERSMEPAT